MAKFTWFDLGKQAYLNHSSTKSFKKWLKMMNSVIPEIPVKFRDDVEKGWEYQSKSVDKSGRKV